MILLTGGAGFIGSHTAAYITSLGTPVRVLDDLSTGKRENLDGIDAELVVGDIRDEATVHACMQGCTGVIHLAARPGVPDSVADPLTFDSVNVHGTLVVLETARRLGVERVAYASSAAIYGPTEELPVREELGASPMSPYGANKAADELYAQVYSAELGVTCVGLRYFNVFGPRQDPRGPYAAVTPRFVERALQGQPLTIFGDGEQSRDFVSVLDVARANWLAVTRPGVVGGRAYNIGTGRGTTVNELAAYVLDVVPQAAGVTHGPERPGDIRHSIARVTLAKRNLGWTAEADFDAAMRETVAWYAGLVR